MDKKRAVELLIQAVDEIPYLKNLHYKNDEFQLWLKKVENIIRVGLEPDDHNKYWSASQSLEILHGVYDDNVYQKEYSEKITRYEIALKSIIQKYEILGIETEPEAKVELPDVIKDEEKAGKELELTLAGTPDMLLAPMSNVVKNLNSQGYKYGFRRTSGRPDYTNWDKTYFASYAISQGTEGQIGTISFQLILNDRTLLKSTQPENWNPSFQYFMNYLLAEFQRLEFADFKKEKPAAIVEQLPKAFISHGKESVALTKLEEFLRTLGVEPLIVKDRPSLDKDLPDKVNSYLSQADFVVVLATGDDKVGDKLQPRQNVIHEIGLAQKTHAGKIIYLLEEGAEFPSNISPRVWERFKQRNMIKAFLCIVRELRAYGMLKLIKPQPKEQT